MSNVFVLDTNKQPLNPVPAGRARLLLKQGKAAVWRRFPFTIILQRTVPDPHVTSLRIKLDPGSKTTGIAVLNDVTGEVVFAAELVHRGHKITAARTRRRAVRRSRRQRKTRYRQPRFDNRRNQKPDWLPPSLQSRISNVLTWVRRLSRLCPRHSISLELVKFDLQQMANPEISGVQYQQGTLAGSEVRAYLLEKWGRQCAYCGAKNVPLEIEHITPRSKSRDDRVCNLTLACHPCNEKKGTQDIRAFLKDQPDLLHHILAMAVAPRHRCRRGQCHPLGVIPQTPGIGIADRVRLWWPHAVQPNDEGTAESALDRCCVCGAKYPQVLLIQAVCPLLVTAQGHGCRQLTNVDRFGFPRGKPKQGGRILGFKTGDVIRAIVPSGRKTGRYSGRVLVRASGSFDLQTKTGRVHVNMFRHVLH